MSCAKALLMMTVCFVSHAQTVAPTAKQMNDKIEKEGAKAVIEKLTAHNQAEWHRVVRRIDLGSPEWLGIAGKLLKGSDAGTSEDLRISLAVALTHNPEGVLRMAGSDLPLEQVCTVPFIEPSKHVVANHKLRVKAALRRVTAKDLTEKKAACLKSIERVQ